MRTYAELEYNKNGDVSLNACATAATAARKGSVIRIFAVVFSMQGTIKLEVMSSLIVLSHHRPSKRPMFVSPQKNIWDLKVQEIAAQFQHHQD